MGKDRLELQLRFATGRQYSRLPACEGMLCTDNAGSAGCDSQPALEMVEFVGDVS